jgi:polyglutamine-binding protein 1
MPLPAALLARLKQRGIVKAASTVENDPEEEVIAEDYDDPEPKETAPVIKHFQPVPLADGETVAGCPNKYNIYHECTSFCRQTWSGGKQVPSPKTERKYKRLLKRYPLPEGWQEVWESGVACFYFWNTVNDEVSWLPPHHPKAKVSISAAKLKSMMKEENLDRDDSNDEDGESDEEQSDDSESPSEASEESEPEKDAQPKAVIRPPPPKRPRQFERKTFGQERRGKVKRNDVDPMDPSAYSDTCPKGKWADGLDTKGSDNPNQDTN